MCSGAAQAPSWYRLKFGDITKWMCIRCANVRLRSSRDHMVCGSVEMLTDRTILLELLPSTDNGEELAAVTRMLFASPQGAWPAVIRLVDQPDSVQGLLANLVANRLLTTSLPTPVLAACAGGPGTVVCLIDPGPERDKTIAKQDLETQLIADFRHIGLDLRDFTPPEIFPGSRTAESVKRRAL
ncbi:hypothetical protein, partial [Sutterella sp.]|uniref:hypothetical protein n=1 Tax=Sutterella sp. TaxID=1981025 RepID=UPI0026E009BE